MNRRRKIYRGFNKRNKFLQTKIIAVVISITIVGGYAYIKLKDVEIGSIFSNNKIISTISDKINLFNKPKSEVITSDDISNELDKIKSEEEQKKEEDIETSNIQENEDIKLAKTDGWNFYTIQVASVKEDKDMEKIESTLTKDKIPYSIVEIDGMKKVQTYSYFEESSARTHLEDVKKSFPDAFISEMKIPMLSLEYTNKYAYVEEISNELNKLITNFKEESSFWEKNKDEVDKEKYNQILTNRKNIVDSIQGQVEKIDYSGMSVFKDNLGKYMDDVDGKITQSSKATNEEQYNVSKGLFVSCMQGYFSFINMIKGA